MCFLTQGTSNGKPDMAREWLNNPGVAYALDSFQGLMLNQRKHSYLNLSEYRDENGEL